MHHKENDTDVTFMEVPMTKQGRLDFYREHLPDILKHTAVFAVSDVYAIELMQFLWDQGISVPNDISVVGFDNISLCENVYPRLTTVGQNPTERARLAVNALHRLRTGASGETVEMLPVKLIARNSVKNITGKGKV